MRRFAIALITGAIASLLGGEAIAEMVKDTKGNVYFWGTEALMTPEGLDFIRDGQSLVRELRVGYCGEVRIRVTNAPDGIPEEPIIEGTPYSLANSVWYENGGHPRCRNAAWTTPPPASGVFQDRQGNAYFVTSLTPGTRATVDYNGWPRADFVRPNRCGFFVLRNRPDDPLPATGMLGVQIDIANMPVGNPPLCRRDVTNPGGYVIYLPD